VNWPADHPACQDPRLAKRLSGVDEICPDAMLGPVLRHVPNRRITVRITTASGPRVLKIFGGPRARGNHRRLLELGRSSVADRIPATFGVDSAGHVGLIAWQSGVPLDQLEEEAFVAACGEAGRILKRVHTSGAKFDRTWTAADEFAQLERRATDRTRPLMELARRVARRAANEPVVSAHRDFHPRQVIADGGRVSFIDLDDAALAPATLDVGNFVAHLEADVLVGRRDCVAGREASQAFLQGYGAVDGDLPAWTWLALVRLAGLADSRHARPDWAEQLVAAASGRTA
jgi:hypothetical protein